MTEYKVTCLINNILLSVRDCNRHENACFDIDLNNSLNLCINPTGILTKFNLVAYPVVLAEGEIEAKEKAKDVVLAEYNLEPHILNLPTDPPEIIPYKVFIHKDKLRPGDPLYLVQTDCKYLDFKNHPDIHPSKKDQCSIFTKFLKNVFRSEESSEKHRRKLPTLTSEYLHQKFGIAGKSPSGMGAQSMIEARSYWNEGNSLVSFELFQVAIKKGIGDPYLSAAHSLLGQIFVQRGNLAAAVDEFLKCLKVPYRDRSDTWQSAKRLYYIYSEAALLFSIAKRMKEAISLYELAEFANQKLNWTHTPNVETELRDLTRESGLY